MTSLPAHRFRIPLLWPVLFPFDRLPFQDRLADLEISHPLSNSRNGYQMPHPVKNGLLKKTAPVPAARPPE